MIIVVGLSCLILLLSKAGAATILYAVSGDGATVRESLFEINQIDGSATFRLQLGRGVDGEAIAFNSVDSLIYHASGLGVSPGAGIFERIDSSLTAVTDIPLSDVGIFESEASALTWDASRSSFLWGTGTDELWSVTADGSCSFIAKMDHFAKGLAYLGASLYSVGPDDPALHSLDPNTGATRSSISITLPGVTVLGATGLAANPETGELWALLVVQNQPRNLVKLDTSTGVATRIGLLDDKYAGIAFAVPEPGTAGLLVTGLFLFGRRGFRRAAHGDCRQNGGLTPE